MGTYTDWNSSLLPIHTKNEMCLHKLNESLYVRAHTKTAEDNSMRVRIAGLECRLSFIATAACLRTTRALIPVGGTRDGVPGGHNS